MFIPPARALSPTEVPLLLENLTKTAKNTGYDTSLDLVKILSILLQSALTVIGVVFLFMMLWAGFNWMTAMGDKEKVTKARETIIASAIGIVIIISAYAITKFVFTTLGVNK